MKKKLKKDNILKKYVTVIIIVMCVFGLCLGTLIAMGNTKKQLKNVNNNVITEKEVVEFINKAATKFNGIKVVY